MTTAKTILIICALAIAGCTQPNLCNDPNVEIHVTSMYMARLNWEQNQ